MARHKDVSWILPEPKVETWEQAGVAVLMDLRDALMPLRRLDCPEFLSIPSRLKEQSRALRSLVKLLRERLPKPKRRRRWRPARVGYGVRRG